jgi:hypothetical protein
MKKIGSDKEIKIKIADITISFDRSGIDFGIELDRAYQPFFVGSQADIIIHLKDNIPDFPSKEVIFDSAPVWILYKDTDRSIIKVFPEEEIPFQERVLVFDSRFRSTDLYIRPNPLHSSFPLDPLMFPVGELLMINFLASNKGLILHSCGIKIGGEGFLFVGISGAGKSTWASMWEKENHATILSDDRIVVRKRDGIFWIYGTPWHGDVKLASPKGVPLKKVFFIRHDVENTAKRLVGIDAVSKYLVCSFPPFWSPEGMKFTLAFLSDLSSRVPGYDLGFLPDSTALDFIMATD